MSGDGTGCSLPPIPRRLRRRRRVRAARGLSGLPGSTHRRTAEHRRAHCVNDPAFPRSPAAVPVTVLRRLRADFGAFRGAATSQGAAFRASRQGGFRGRSPRRFTVVKSCACRHNQAVKRNDPAPPTGPRHPIGPQVMVPVQGSADALLLVPSAGCPAGRLVVQDFRGLIQLVQVVVGLWWMHFHQRY